MDDQRHNSLLEAVFAADPGCVAVLLGADLIFAYVNPAYRFILPVTCKNPVGKSYYQIWKADHPLAIQDHLREVLETGRPYLLKDVEYRFSDGTKRFFSVQARRFTWDQKLAVLLILWDITERKNAEKAVRSIALFPEQNPHPILRLSVHGILLYANQATKNHLGDIHIGKTTIPALVQQAQQAYQSRENRVMEYKVQDRTYAFLLVPVYENGGYINLYGQDITDRKQATEALQQSNERLKRAQEMAHLGSWELDLNTDRLTWSDEIYRIFGLQPQEFTASYEAFLEAVHPEDRAAVDAAYNGSIQAGLDSYEIEHRVVRKPTGEIRFVHEICEHIRDDAGRIVRSVGMVQDITENQQKERILQRSEQRYQSLFHQMGEGFTINEIICDPEGNPVDYRFLDVNPAFERLTGLKREEVVGKTLTQVLPGEDPKWIREFGKVALTGQPARFENYSPILKKYYDVFAYQPAPGQFAVISMDVTHRKLAEAEARAGMVAAELRQHLLEQREQERLQLARDLHDGPVQELLAAIYAIQTISTGLEENGEANAALARVQQDLKQQVADLRDFASELRPPTLFSFGIVTTLRSHLDTFQEKHPNLKIDFEACQDGDLLPASIGLALFRIYQEALNNILKHSQATRIKIYLEKDEHNACLEIRDNGVGFEAPDNWVELARNKHLGMVGMRERAEALGGKLSIDSLPGKGTSIRVEIPVDGSP